MSMLHDITSTTPRYKKPTRKGRGEASKGKTSGRGNKGAKARVGKYVKRGHEHGQTPIWRRFPKRGFSNHDFANRFYVVNLQDLERFDAGTTVDAAALIEAGLVPNEKWPVKILGEGGLTKKLTIIAGWYSKSAHEKITALGGTAQNLKGEAFEFPKPKKKFVPREKVSKKAAAAATEEGAAPAAPAPAGGGEAPATEAKE
jgi:large subunit ribosomal protein L15